MRAEILPGRGRINRSSIEAMRAWSAILGVSQVEILVAVAAVGPRYQDVQSYLAEKFCFSSREVMELPGALVPETNSLAA